MNAQNALQQAVAVLTPLLMALLAWGVAEVARWVRSHVQNAYLQGVLVRLDEAVSTVVTEVAQTEVDAVRGASEDGKISADEARALKDAAITKIKEYLGKRAVTDLEKAFDTATVQRMIESKVEAAVAAGKKAA